MWKLMGWVLSETTSDSKTLSIGGVGGIKVLLILTIYTYTYYNGPHSKWHIFKKRLLDKLVLAREVMNR